MSSEIPHSFHRFKMSSGEALVSSCLTTMQKQHIHNLRVETAESLLNLEDNLENPLEHVKERARLMGQLQAYAGLINLSDNAEEALRMADGQKR